MSGRFDGKVALVTGGNSGIGKATAVQFAREGAKVVIAARRIKEGEETVDVIREGGGEAIFVRTDVTRASDVEAMVARTMDVYGRLDSAFNNAGVAGPGRLPHEHTEDAWDSIIDVNLKGVWLCMKYEIPRMLEQGGGAIVNDSSVAGLIAGVGIAYVASKHGVIGLTKTAALAYVKEGIRVNAVCPGWIDTPMIDTIFEDPERQAGLAARQPMGRLGTPEEVAETVLWLCSDAASLVTGHAMAVDGGILAGR